jgi:hypothetical protein
MRLQFFSREELEDLQSALQTLEAPLTGRSDSGLPGGGQGRVDRVGVVPKDVCVDPGITEGHPGYDESGPSEIHPRERRPR